MSHVDVGERVFVQSDDMFGDVTRTTVLGINAIGLVDDEGVTRAFFGSKARSDIAQKGSGQTGDGVTVDVPLDVKTEGAGVLSAMNISPAEQGLMFIKFMGMFDKVTRRAYMGEWVKVRDDPTQRAAFLQKIKDDLSDEEAFVRIQGNKVLASLEPKVRQAMFERMMTLLTKEERESLILEWTSVRNFPHREEEFLQGMYELLMDDDDYIEMEGRRQFTALRILADRQSEIFQSFMTTVSAEDRAKYVAEYRKVRNNPSKRKAMIESLISISVTT